ncbi:ABC transporter permease, partial [Sphingobacterium shayense]|nr:ABC transporter permease [Sphingobacterium shayense]
MEINFEFRKERKLGEIVQDFVNLVRLIFEHFVRTILGLAAIPLCLILVLVYFGTTKINLTTSEGWEGNREVILIAILTACILVVVSLIFYGLAIEYFILLKNKRSTAFGTKDVWDGFKRNIRKYFVF